MSTSPQHHDVCFTTNLSVDSCLFLFRQYSNKARPGISNRHMYVLYRAVQRDWKLSLQVQDNKAITISRLKAQSPFQFFPPLSQFEVVVVDGFPCVSRGIPSLVSVSKSFSLVHAINLLPYFIHPSSLLFAVAYSAILLLLHIDRFCEAVLLAGFLPFFSFLFVFVFPPPPIFLSTICTESLATQDFRVKPSTIPPDISVSEAARPGKRRASDIQIAPRPKKTMTVSCF